MIVYIYVLKHPLTTEIRYVGLTRYPKKRLINEIHKAHTPHLRNWIEAIKRDGMRPTMEIIEEANEIDASERESIWISFYKERGARLINFTSGGEKGFTVSEETKEKLRIVTRRKRRPMSAEHKAAISAANIGKKCPWASQNVQIAIQSNIGRKMSDDAKKHLSELQKNVMVGERLRKLTEGNKRRERASKFTHDQKAEMKLLIKEGYSIKVIADHYGASMGSIGDARKGNIWAKVEPAIVVPNPPPYKTIPLIRLENGQYRRTA